MTTIPWIKEELDLAGASYKPLHHHRAMTARELAQAERFSASLVVKVVALAVNDSPQR